jgi:predicted membrane protein
VVRLVLREGLVTSLARAAAGLGAAFALGGAMRDVIFRSARRTSLRIS